MNAHRRRPSANRLAIPVEDWPERDKQAWDKAFVSGGLWADGGAGAAWSSAHREHVAWGYGRWLGFLDKRGELDDQVDPQRLAIYVAELKAAIGTRSVSNYVKHLYEALRIMGCAENLQWLSQINATLRRQIVPTIHKRPRLRDTRDLLDLGLSLMSAVIQRQQTPSISMAAQYRDGLIIALLAYRPLRRRTLVCIRIGQHLVKIDDRWWLVFTGKDTKTGQPLEFEWPRALESYLDTYLSRFRPRFKHADTHDFLWASKNGRPLGGLALNHRICRHTERAFGRSISIHLFRDCMATTIAQRDPKHVGIAKSMLGHSRLDATYLNYIQAGSLEASRSHANAIKDIRHRLVDATVKAE